jgi:hypothetical protein
VLGHTHRKDRLHLLLILPDGSKSLVPADWTSLNSTPGLTALKQSATLASLDDLLHMRTVIDALLRRLALAKCETAKPNTNQESNGANPTQPFRSSSPGDLRLGTTGSGTTNHHYRSPGTPDRQGSPGQDHSGAKQ